MAELEELRLDAKKEKAEAELITMHPDFMRYVKMIAFITGQNNNLSGYRMLCMKT